MARPKRQLQDIGKRHYFYFWDAFREGGRRLDGFFVRREKETDFDAYWRAHEAFKTLDTQKDDEAFKAAFVAWHTEFVTDIGWRRCQSALRQRTYKHVRRPHSVKLTENAYYLLRNWCDGKGLTLADGVLALIENERSHKMRTDRS